MTSVTASFVFDMLCFGLCRFLRRLRLCLRHGVVYGGCLRGAFAGQAHAEGAVGADFPDFLPDPFHGGPLHARPSYADLEADPAYGRLILV